MTKFDDAMGWLDLEIDTTEDKLEKLRTARAVLEQYAPAGSALLKPKLTPQEQKAIAVAKERRKPARPAPAKVASPPVPDRRAAIAAAAAKVAPKKAPPAKIGLRPCGCVNKGQHRSGCKLRAKPAAPKAEPAPAAPSPVVAAREAPVLRLSVKTGKPVKSKALGERLYRCTVPVTEEFGSAGRGIAKSVPCGQTVWDGSRAKHLHKEQGLIDPELGVHFEQLRDPEEDAA